MSYSSTLTVAAPDGARIVLNVVEADGSVTETVLWGPGADESLSGVVAAAVAVPAGQPSLDATAVLGEVVVDDGLTVTVDGEVLDAAAVGERIAAFVVRAVVAALGEHRAGSGEAPLQG
jgi:hypothetical protein